MQKLEKDDIILRKSILHILDMNYGKCELSDTLLDPGPGLNDFLRNHIYKLIDSDDLKKCSFEQNNTFIDLIKKMDEKDDSSFILITKELAEKLFDIMVSSIEIPGADFVCVSYQLESIVYLALLKINYKENFAHFKMSSGQNNIVLKKFMSSGSRLSEAVIINLSNYQVQLIERSYKINDEKINYLSERFLMCHTDLAPKRKFNILTRVINDINNKYDSADVQTKLETKSRLQKEFEETQEFNVNEIGDRIFGHSPEKKEAFDDRMERYDMQYDKFSVTKENTIKSLEKQTITTDTGIEISIPMEEYIAKDNLIITKEPDGTTTITIKNIENTTVK